MARSLASAAMASISPRSGARSTRRAVSSRSGSFLRACGRVMADEFINEKGEPTVGSPLDLNKSGAGEKVSGSRYGLPLFSSLGWLDRDEALAAGLGGKAHLAVDQCEDRVVLAQAHIGAGVPFGAALAHDDVAGDDGFA